MAVKEREEMNEVDFEQVGTEKKIDMWTTNREMWFLDAIMDCTNKFFNPKVGIKQTLQNYLATLDKRVWDGDIDVPAIRLYAESLLAKCR